MDLRSFRDAPAHLRLLIMRALAISPAAKHHRRQHIAKGVETPGGSLVCRSRTGIINTEQ
jgi:hypothetical protein